jgi:hypothetical protein
MGTSTTTNTTTTKKSPLARCFFLAEVGGQEEEGYGPILCDTTINIVIDIGKIILPTIAIAVSKAVAHDGGRILLIVAIPTLCVTNSCIWLWGEWT